MGAFEPTWRQPALSGVIQGQFSDLEIQAAEVMRMRAWLEDTLRMAHAPNRPVLLMSLRRFALGLLVFAGGVRRQVGLVAHAQKRRDRERDAGRVEPLGRRRRGDASAPPGSLMVRQRSRG